MSETIDIFNQEQITAALVALNAAIAKSWLISMPVWQLDYGVPRSLPEAGGTVAGELVGSQYIVQLLFYRSGSVNVSDATTDLSIITLDSNGDPIGRPYVLYPPEEIILEYGIFKTKKLLSNIPFTVNLETL